MALRNTTYYAALLIGLLVLIGIGLSVLSALLGFVWSLVTTLASLLVIGALWYAGVKIALWLRSGSDDSTESVDAPSAPSAPGSSVDRLTERYVDGDLSEAEFERRIERELETDRLDEELDRTVEFDRSN